MGGTAPVMGRDRGAAVRRYVVLALAVVALGAGIGMARADLVNHYESSYSMTEGCLGWSEYTEVGTSYKTVQVSLCGRRWSSGGSSSYTEVVAERVVRECSYTGCGDTYRERYEGSATDAEFSANPDTGVLLFNLDLAGEGGSSCVARGTGATNETSSSSSSGPWWRGEGSRDWARVTVSDGRTERGASVGANSSYPYASVFQNDRYWSHRTGSGNGEACGWAEAQGDASASIYTYVDAESNDSINPSSPVSTSTSTTLPQPPNPNDPPPDPGNTYFNGIGSVNRGGYSEGVTDSGGYLGVYWYQGVDQWMSSGSAPQPPYVGSSLWAVVGNTYFELPLTPASVLYDPVADRYQIDAAVEGCEVHLTLAAPTNRNDSSHANAGVVGNYAGAAKSGSADPWVYTGTGGSWTGSSLYTFSYEGRAYSGTVCGTAVEMPGDIVYGMYSQINAY